MIAFLVISLLVLSFLGFPIAWALGISSVGAIVLDGTYPMIVVAQKFISGMNSFSLMAIPFFVLAGNLMSSGGITKSLLNIAKALVGWMRGSISIICIIASMFFGAISGSAIATASSIGGMTIPEMIREKYDRSYAAAVTTAAAICGPLIPPSIGLIVYASITSISVRELFLGTAVPGVLYGLVICAIAYAIACKRQYQKHERATIKELLCVFKEGAFAIIMPVIILGCIFGGITTPTEAFVIAVAYALIIGLFVQKDLKWSALPKIFYESAITTACMMILIGASKIVGWIFAVTNFSNDLVNWITGSLSSRVTIVAFVILIGLVLGCLMDVTCAILIITPVLYPLAETIGYSAVEFGVILVTLLTLGHLTPPVGASLLLANSIAEANITDTIKDVLPFFLGALACVILMFLFPDIISFML